MWDREQYTYALFTVDKVNYCGLEKKKKKKKRKPWRRNVDVGFIANQTVTMTLSVSHNSASFPMFQSYSTSTREGEIERGIFSECFYFVVGECALNLLRKYV